MYNVAVVKDNKIINVVVVDSEVGLQALPIFLPDMDNFILQTEETGIAFVNGTVLNNKFVMPSPYPSWIFNESTWQWEAPKPVNGIPNGKYPQWNEEAKDWDLFDIPEFIEE